jgi:hypothetical protein
LLCSGLIELLLLTLDTEVDKIGPLAVEVEGPRPSLL